MAVFRRRPVVMVPGVLARLVIFIAVLTVIFVACGVEEEQAGDAVTPWSVGSAGGEGWGDFWPPAEVTITREKAIEIALRLCTTSGPEVQAVENPHSPVARLMTYGEYEKRLGGSSTQDPSVLVWLVQFEGDSFGGGISTADGSEPPLFRYVGCALNAGSGEVRGGFRRRSEPLLLPRVFIDQIPTEKPDPNSGIIVPASGVTAFSRDDVLAMVHEKYDSRRARPDLVEIELVAYTEMAGLSGAPPTPIPPTSTSVPVGKTVTPRIPRFEGGRPPLSIDRLAWLVIIPREPGSSNRVLFGPVDDFLFCIYAASWELIDAQTGETGRLPSGGMRTPPVRVTGDESAALKRFAWAEGWWELCHRVKEYAGEELPAGFAANLDRPDAVRPTPYPTSTPDPNATSRPTPTPAPTETAAQKALRTPAPAATAASPGGNQTPDDIRAKWDRHPEEHRIWVNNDVFILFAYQNGFTDWVAPVFIYHAPSITQVLLNYDGTVISDKNVKGDEARAAVDLVLADEKLMAEIADHERLR